MENWKRKEDITVAEIKNMDTFKDWDDQKAEQFARIIKKFTEIAYHIHSSRKSGKVIALNIDNQMNTAA